MTSDGRTFAALLTPLAPGAIAVVGILGAAADTIAAGLLRRRNSDAPPSLPSNKPIFCRLVDQSQTIDDVVAVRIADSNTLERIELNTHGGVRIAQRTLLMLESAGAETVSEFDYLAMLHGDDSVRHAIDIALVHAESRRLTMWLLQQRELLPDCLKNLDRLTQKERDAFTRRSAVAERLLRGLRVAIIGPPNAGKSTLANRFIGKDRVITSEQAGTTRDWVSETALLDGWPITLTDTAGMRETGCEIEREAIRRAREQAAAADVLLIVLDTSDRKSDPQTQLREIAPDDLAPTTPRVIAINKCDRIEDTSPLVALESEAIPISALRGDGLDQLEHRLCKVLGLDLLRDDLPTAIDQGMLATKDH